MSDRSIEERLRVFEDIQEIKRLKSLYGRYWDWGFRTETPDIDERAAMIADLFVDDGFWGDVSGEYESRGRDAIVTFVRFILKRHVVDQDGRPREHTGSSLHIFGNESIEVDGDTAVGHWPGLIAASDASRGQSIWMAIHYEDTFVRTPAGWRFRSLRFDRAFATSFDGPGWVKERFEQAAAAASG